jgi:hypothetical protein
MPKRKRPSRRKSAEKPKTKAAASHHKRDFEGLLDLAIKAKKVDN